MVELADSIQKWLKDLQEFQRPPGFRWTPCGRQEHKYRRTLIDFEPKTIHSREDVDKLSTSELQAFVRSKPSNRLNTNRTKLRSLAHKAWNKLRVVRSNAIAPEELQDSADFDKLPTDGLRIWIKSSGWTRGTASMKRADLIDLARRVQSNPALVRSTSPTFDKVRSREDLLRLSKASLRKWIRSRGYTVDTLTVEETLNHAYTVWNHVEGVVDAHEAKGNSSAVKLKKINSAKKEVKKVKNRSELISTNKVQLFDWIVSHELVVPENYDTRRRKSLSCWS